MGMCWQATWSLVMIRCSWCTNNDGDGGAWFDREGDGVERGMMVMQRKMIGVSGSLVLGPKVNREERENERRNKAGLGYVTGTWGGWVELVRFSFYFFSFSLG